MLEAMRRYFLDERADLPDGIRLFFWPYAGRRQTVLRGVGVLIDATRRALPLAMGDFLKYFPAAFWLAFDMPEQVRSEFAGREINPRGHAIDEKCELSIPTRAEGTLRADWPEHPDDAGGLFLNDKVCVYADPA